MFRPRSLSVFALLAVGVLTYLVSTTTAQDKEDPKPQPRLKGTLPMNFRLLGLSEEQKQQIYKIQNDFDAKLAALEEQIKKVKVEERQAIEKVLTDAQRARLKEILKEKSGVGESGSESKSSGTTTGKP
jgi:Spy/CpxP family protein refolding chaperone